MTPGPAILFACPACGDRLQRGSLGSGNTFGATLWSDARLEAPMLPDERAFARCACCETWFWFDDAPELGSYDWFRDEVPPEGWAGVTRVEDPGPEGYAAALAAGLGTTREREAYLRLRAWWAAGDAVRGTDAAPEPDTDNLRRLTALFTRVRGERAEPVIHAAVAHGLGDTAAALAALDRARLAPDTVAAFRAHVESGERRIVALAGPARRDRAAT